jgi:hypothetical protein
MLEKSLGR